MGNSTVSLPLLHPVLHKSHLPWLLLRRIPLELVLVTEEECTVGPCLRLLKVHLQHLPTRTVLLLLHCLLPLHLPVPMERLPLPCRLPTNRTERLLQPHPLPLAIPTVLERLPAIPTVPLLLQLLVRMILLEGDTALLLLLLHNHPQTIPLEDTECLRRLQIRTVLHSNSHHSNNEWHHHTEIPLVPLHSSRYHRKHLPRIPIWVHWSFRTNPISHMRSFHPKIRTNKLHRRPWPTIHSRSLTSRLRQHLRLLLRPWSLRKLLRHNKGTLLLHRHLPILEICGEILDSILLQLPRAPLVALLRPRHRSKKKRRKEICHPVENFMMPASLLRRWESCSSNHRNSQIRSF
mmetsp:Transcript_25743/g.47980  ORF Transcript_25743/g.47980 Transcript_25743/m.47980 type:complete len:348 (-) Transcript_25743:1038-2081(-)